MKILLLGKNGQVGWELQRSLAPLGALTALDRRGLPAHAEHEAMSGDLTDLHALASTVQRLRPDVIVNAAAHTAVDRAEAEPALAQRLNAEAPHALARAAHAIDALLVHYSTDYVFDGGGSAPWQEDDATGPLSVYGRSKLAGEQAIRASGCRHLIFRTSWVYAARGGNFAKTMLRLAQEREELRVIDDQWGAPTGAELIADVTAHALRQVRVRPQDLGTFHLAAAGATSWRRYAEQVLSRAKALAPELKLVVKNIVPIQTAEYPTPAQRPLNSRLDLTKLQNTFGLQLPDWQQGVDRMLTEVLA